jgi:DnaJ homologue, subfamily C, member 28, conserved domain
MSQPKPKSLEKFESLAERKIREAQAEGQFDALPGFGKPIPDLDGPDDENWWIKNKLRQEGLVILPPILEARRDIEKTLEAVRSMNSERQVRLAIKALNERIRAAHFSPAGGPADGVRPVDLEAVVQSWRAAKPD